MHMNRSTIWPMFHYLPGDINFQEEQWDGYCRANRIFADYIAGMAADGDVVWIHDYHLMLLPTTLRQSLDSSINVKIGFFLHIPFPTSEVYRYEPVMLVSNDLSCRVLPYRREVLEGLLSSDLIGFHTYDYARHFLTSCTRILGLNTSPTSVEYGDRVVKIGAYPVGVEPEKFAEVSILDEYAVGLTCIVSGRASNRVQNCRASSQIPRTENHCRGRAA